MEASIKEEDASGRHPVIASPRNFWGGFALFVLSAAAYWLLGNLSAMHGYTFGAGTMPRLIAGLLAALSVVLIGMGLAIRGSALPTLALRGPLMLFSAIIFFALAVSALGIVITSFLTYLIAALATKETRWGEAVVAGVCMTVFCTVLFYYGLSLPFALWPAL
ncbi:MAG TPA: tripartite tricarboxylate transporter TctB family protein [Pararhizobium sp.]|uniref:tripartite tricarboxylate transporter TctB family protein n=1 Tax=Pararhizobium sp. TaxID=1977563 RepID=UPI002CCD15CB|nr:tripartite tricarboxylate transporter TctB family protein [Pararhizobium sp.]HTO34152.1 tripartite tricarboxylate transporter TctB family protein [Pararhizobium sp.]